MPAKVSLVWRCPQADEDQLCAEHHGRLASNCVGYTESVSFPLGTASFLSLSGRSTDTAPPRRLVLQFELVDAAVGEPHLQYSR
jgi:hypothetical protein